MMEGKISNIWLKFLSIKSPNLPKIMLEIPAEISPTLIKVKEDISFFLVLIKFKVVQLESCGCFTSPQIQSIQMEIQKRTIKIIDFFTITKE